MRFTITPCVLLALLTALVHAQPAATPPPSTRPATQPASRPANAGARINYPVDPDSRPQPNVPKGKLFGPTLFKSSIFAGTVREYSVYVPADYDADEPACVLVFQDGQRAVNPNGSLRIPIVMDNLIAKKQMPVTIGIFITPGQRGEAMLPGYGPGNNPNNRSTEYDSLGNKYARFIVEEMLPEVGKLYSLTKDPDGRCIGGTSSGAICAFTVAWEKPEAFHKVISCIGSFTNIKGGHVYPDLIRKSEAKPIRIFLEDTLHDNPSPNNPSRDWHLQNEAMLAALTEKKYDVTHEYAEGTHSDSHGGSIMPQMLRWIWRDYPGVGSRQ